MTCTCTSQDQINQHGGKYNCIETPTEGKQFGYFNQSVNCISSIHYC